MLAMERKLHKSLLSSQFPPRAAAVALMFLVVFFIFFPLLLSGRLSFSEAEMVCFERRKKIKEFEVYAFDSLLPNHYYMSASTMVSLLGFLFWLFKSPHRNANEDGKHLDICLGSFFMVQLYGSIVVLVSVPLEICTSNSYVYFYLYYAGLSLVGTQVLGTSLLSHRYILLKASFLNKVRCLLVPFCQ